MRKRSLLRTSWEVLRGIIFMALLSAVITFSLGGMLGFVWGQVLIQTICLLIWLGTIYGVMWTQGDRERNFVQFGRMEPDLLWGLKVGLMACVLPVLTGIIPILCKAQVVPDIIFVYKLLNPHLLVLINCLLSPDIYTYESSWWQVLAVNLYQLLIPAASAAGYLLGYNRISLMEKLVYKNKKKPGSPGKNLKR